MLIIQKWLLVSDIPRSCVRSGTYASAMLVRFLQVTSQYNNDQEWQTIKIGVLRRRSLHTSHSDVSGVPKQHSLMNACVYSWLVRCWFDSLCDSQQHTPTSFSTTSMVALRKIALLALDMASTVLTLMTGLRENPVLVFLTGRYDHIRARMRQRRINYNIVREDHVNVTMLPDLVAVADTHRFYSAPKRTRDNLGEDRSTCMNVNSMSSTVLALNYDDFFGKGARREQVFAYSISAPHCSIINFKTAWYDECVNGAFSGNATACHEFIFDNFDALKPRRAIQAGVPVDFGERGTPLMKCSGRPLQPFLYLTDLMVMQSFWAGGAYHIEVQSSECWAQPLLRDNDWQWGLFKTEPADDRAEVVFAVEPISDFANAISVLYGIVSIAMILRGIYVALSLNNLVVYLPSKLRRKILGTLQLPSMALASRFTSVDVKKFDLVLCRGENLFASDLWMNHWLYILLSIADSLVNMRTTYSVLEMGSWMITKKRDFDNFIFVCSAITKITWTMCFVHTVFRFVIQLALRMLHAMAWFHNSRLVSFLHWYVNSVAMFMSYKIYAVLLSTTLLGMYRTKKTTTTMRHQEPYKRPVYGGFPNLMTFWGNEIICDFFVLCSIQLVVAHAFASLVLLTRYRRATYNRVLRLIQERFFFVGWDIMVVMEALGVDPLNEELVNSNGVATTDCSLGALIQQLYASGPSGLVELVGDSAFMRKVDDTTDEDPVIRYPLDVAQDMGLYKATRMNSLAPIEPWRQTIQPSIERIADSVMPGDFKGPLVRQTTSMIEMTPIRRLSGTVTPSIAQRQLHLHAEWRWGRILFVDYINSPGELRKNKDGTLLEFVVQDALVFLQKDDFHPLLTKTKSLHIS